MTMETKFIRVSKKTHKKVKKEAADKGISMQALADSKLSVLLLIFVSSALFFSQSYAEEIQLPLDEPFDDSWCVFLSAGDHVQFTCHWKWFLPDYVIAEINQTEIPSLINEMPQHNIDLADKIRLLLEHGEPSSPSKDVPTIIEDEPEEEPLTFEERQIQASIKKLDECLRGIGAWAAYQAQTDIEHFVDESRFSFADRDNLSQNIQILRILKAIEECDIMRTYERMHLIGAYELNKVLADLADKDYLGRGSAHPLEKMVTDQSDAMVETDPVTDKDIADEIEDMERILDDLIEQKVFKDPDADFTGENRGGQPLGLKCQIHGQPAPLFESPQNVCPLSKYDAHILRNWESITYKDILSLQCDNFLYIYQHKIGTDDFPQWLNHCVPKVVRE